MNNIQKLIKELKVEKSKADRKAIALLDANSDEGYVYSAKGDAFDLCIQKLELLLKDESKQPQPPDFANTMLGEVPHEVNAQSEDTTQAVEGATPVVRQNEQTVKPCRCCLAEIKNDVGDGLCAECWSKLLTY